MKFKQAQKASDIANLVKGTFKGPDSLFAYGLNEIHRVEAGDIAFVDHPKYYEKVLNSPATLILIDKEVASIPEGKGIIICESPCNAFNFLGKTFNPPKGFHPHPSEAISGKNTWIAEDVKIGTDVRIGENCTIYPGVVLYPGTVVGNDVVIHANAVIGASAFYYQRKDGKHNAMYSCGRVVIGDRVDIGANCTIDKGVTSDTIIGSGSKLDNMIHIGHDTILGENVLMAAQSAIAGCVTIGNNVTIWGNVAVVSGVTIGDFAEILGKSGVTKSIEGAKKYFGVPAVEAREKMKEIAVLKRLSKN
ncbi:UDP-3-O-(3-hydroxymyristoyl)glucosamine N-acyltransferase [Luteibaculum oceani]|uniref:UDP-3-O-(3-hydroxymyristoyl)glucosamine N-acyltransferase n=1 Tax=Luteibaculum oceani TaxID=1294296 RepID=A0A5C6UY75_9FLAO|nr:LpxD N-terminal domain-containing protein [Luteibaculum oceani]TXC78362.1 UDP-3-O-(3-hydroxymyristoyl)glucosamine N-acyltransferase [Luteibaculum oceani]